MFTHASSPNMWGAYLGVCKQALLYVQFHWAWRLHNRTLSLSQPRPKSLCSKKIHTYCPMKLALIERYAANHYRTFCQTFFTELLSSHFSSPNSLGPSLYLTLRIYCIAATREGHFATYTFRAVLAQHERCIATLQGIRDGTFGSVRAVKVLSISRYCKPSTC